MLAERSSLRESLVYWGCRAIDQFRQSANRLESFVGGFSRTALSPEASHRVIARIYDWHPYNREARVFAWERDWWQRSLPPPPARLLVGGCGRGREIQALLSAGYEVYGFDPSLQSIRECQRRNPRATFLGWFGYEALVRAADAHDSALEVMLSCTTFDAVLLGWGSLSNVLDERLQERLFQALDCLAPAGPVLASVTIQAPRTGGGVFHAAGAILGQGLAMFDQGPASYLSDNVRCLAHTGFVYVFDRRRLERLAAMCGRRVEVAERGYYATFWPRTA